MGGKRVAVVGSGITGLSTAWLLTKAGFSVTLYEKEKTLGGHTLTDTSGPVPVDLGFQVYNLTTYPNLVGFLECLGVETEPSEMSFSLSLDGGELEWASEAIFAQRSNLCRLDFLRMVWEVIQFGRRAPAILEPSNVDEYKSMTLGEYLDKEGYSDLFLHCYLLPMCAAVWSVPFNTVLKFPAVVLVRFWVNHHLLDIFQRPRWRVVKGRSREYIKAVTKDVTDVRVGQGVASISSDAQDRITVTTENGNSECFDFAVLATHSDIALKILGQNATPKERELLSALPYQSNDVYLHTDEAYMPKLKSTWCCWNFIGESGKGFKEADVCVSYWCNRLQNLPEGTPDLFVTLNPPSPPEQSKVIRRLQLDHPVFSMEGCDAQGKLDSIQGQRGIYFAGAWCGYGFHEDGINAAINVVKKMGGEIPWVPRSTSPKVSLIESMYLAMFDKFARMGVKRGLLRFILPNGEELLYGDGNVEPDNVEDWRGAPKLKATVRLFNMDFFRKVIFKTDTGLGESYMDGDFEVDDLGGFMGITAFNAVQLDSSRGKLGWLNWLGDRLLYIGHLARGNTLEGSRRNIEEHYDAGNDMYKLFLDNSMTYSSGIYTPDCSLSDSQMNKLDALIDKLGITKSDHVLEIGCGWGSFALRAVQRTGCRVTGLTISQAQLKEAQGRVKAAGLQDRISLVFCDYRQCPGAGTFDKVVSIEMVEAVGYEYLDGYFEVISRMLKPGGAAALQAISVPDERYEAYSNCSDFIREHIFPGGHLPCLGKMIDLAKSHGMSMSNVSDIGPDYAMTLRDWRDAWEEKQADVLSLGYSERFWRKYRMYFAYCESGFDAKYLHNWQVVFKKDGDVTGVNSGEVNERRGVRPTADPITQVLLAIYFFLAGLAVAYKPYLWITPGTSAFFATLVAFLTRSFSTLFPSFQNLSPTKRSWLTNDTAHILYSTLMGLMSLTQLKMLPALTLHPPENGSFFATSLVCIAAGFSGFQVFDLVRNGLYVESPKGLVHFTLLLIVFGSAGFKREHNGLLVMMLIAEWANVFRLCGKVLEMAGVSHRSGVYKVCAGFEAGTFVVLRLLLQFWILIAVCLNAQAFTTVAYYWMAMTGMVYINVTNIHKAVDFWRNYDPQKSHVE